jgi:hypothetical protein
VTTIGTQPQIRKICIDEGNVIGADSTTSFGSINSDIDTAGAVAVTVPIAASNTEEPCLSSRSVVSKTCNTSNNAEE